MQPVQQRHRVEKVLVDTLRLERQVEPREAGRGEGAASDARESVQLHVPAIGRLRAQGEDRRPVATLREHVAASTCQVLRVIARRMDNGADHHDGAAEAVAREHVQGGPPSVSQVYEPRTDVLTARRPRYQEEAEERPAGLHRRTPSPSNAMPTTSSVPGR